MIVYEQELKDGLADITKNTAVAFSTAVKPLADINTEVIAKANLKHQTSDLFFVNSILASTGWNLNDDVFTKAEIWNAKDTPIYKPFNYMHDEKDIIGVIVNSAIYSDKEITNFDDLPEDFDIVTAAVLYKVWENEDLQARMDTLIKEIGENKWCVSMECLYNDFDYAVIDEKGNHSVIKRDKSSAYLTKYLRSYGGNGVYNNRRVGKILKNMTFHAKAIVTQPANTRSIIFNSVNDFIPEKKMPDIDVSKLQTDLAKAQVESEVTKKDLEKAVASNKTLSEQVVTEKANAEKLVESKDKEITELKAMAATVKTEHDGLVTKLNEEKTNLEKALAASNEEKAKLILEKTKATRVSKLVEVKVEKAEAEKIVDKWINASDEQFEDLVKIHATAATASTKETEKVEVTPDLSKAEKVSDTKLSTQAEEETEVQKLQKAMASWVTSNSKKKGDK